jgi:hypothetical protein
MVNVIDVAVRNGAVTTLPDEVHAEIQLQLALEAEENAQSLAAALDEHDRLTRGRGRKHRRIPL